MLVSLKEGPDEERDFGSDEGTPVLEERRDEKSYGSEEEDRAPTALFHGIRTMK